METRMNTRTLTLASAMAVIAIASLATSHGTRANEKSALALGNFSVSLAVKDIVASKAFYDKLDFKQVGGQLEQKWVVMQNGAATIGLFQGMFNKNIMTFNPGWNAAKEPLKDFHDVRELQRQLKARGLTLVLEADEASAGPAHFMLADPDGNTLLFDQHVPRPAR
jgi:catechol 2,3-dioxygenase-like lactoylglutathione lyase family enzyme